MDFRLDSRLADVVRYLASQRPSRDARLALAPSFASERVVSSMVGWWRAYNRLVDIAPLRTSVASSAILWSAGDITAQQIERRVAVPPEVAPFNWRRTAVQVHAHGLCTMVCVRGECMQDECTRVHGTCTMSKCASRQP